MSGQAEVLVERRGPALWIVIDRPARRNSLTNAVLQGIADGYQVAEADRAIRAIVLTGSGDKAFCAGADLEPGRNFAFDHSHPTTPYADLARLARTARVPSIARINGACCANGACAATVSMQPRRCVRGSSMKWWSRRTSMPRSSGSLIDLRRARPLRCAGA